MADTLELSGSVSVSPSTGSPSLVPSIIASISESAQLLYKHYDDVHLTVDGAQSFAFGGGVVNATFLYVKVSAGGPKVKVRITSADGATQSIPVDDFLLLEANSVPITAIDLTRVAGTDTTVSVFIGQKA